MEPPLRPIILATVYAIHDFQAENPDELSFAAGEPIAVTEKDDQYGDGWWQGRNLKGAYGLFPQAYTSPHPTLPPLLTSEGQPTMNETLSEVQNAIDQLHHPPSSSTSLATGLPTEKSASPQHTRTEHTDQSEDDDERSRSDHPTWDSNGGAAKARAALAEKAKADALAHQLVMERLKSASQEQQLHSSPHSPSSSHVSIPELEEMDLSEESGDDDEHRHHSKSPQHPWNQVVVGTDVTSPSSVPLTHNQRPSQIGSQSTQRPSSQDEQESSNFASGPFSAAAIALGLTHTPSSPAKGLPSSSSTTNSNNRIQSMSHQTHKAKQGSSSSILSDITSFATRDLGATSPPIASTLRMSRESFQLAHQRQLHHNGDHSRTDSPSFSATVESALQGRAGSNQDTTPTPNPNPTFSALRSPATDPTSPDSIQEHLISPNNLMPGSLDTVGPFHQRQRSASSADSGIFVRQQTASPLTPHSPLGSALPVTSNNVHTSNSTADSSSAQGSRSRSSSRLAAVEDQLTSPATSTFPSVSGKHQAAGSLSSLGPNGFAFKPISSDPTEWTVADVVEWGKTKGLDEFTISKFSEHEITGDVLLELDVNSLKEIDLIAFGRRVKVTKAIDELRKTGQTQKLGSSSPSPHQDAVQVHSPIDSHTPNSISSTHRRSESASHSNRGPRAPVTPDLAAPSHRSIGSDLLELSDLEGEFNKGGQSLHHSRRKSSLTGLVNEVKKHTGISFVGLNRKSEADSDSIHGDVPSSSRQHAKRQVSRVICQEIILMPLHSERTAEKEELHDAFHFNSPFSHEVEPSNTKKAGKRQQAPKRPGTANSILSRNPFSSSSAAESMVDQPPSPERSTRSGEMKSRTSFLGNIRGGRKPPPQLSSSAQSSYVPSASSPFPAGNGENASSSQGRRGLFTFGHHPQGQVQHQLQASSPLQEIKSHTISSPSPLMEKETNSKEPAISLTVPKGSGQPKSALERIGTPDHVGWMRKKGEKYPTWKMRYFILKNANLYYLKSENEARIKGLIKLPGYKVVMDDDVNPGRYGFKIIHDNGSTHAFSADDSKLLRDWMKAMMKATIDRDWLAPVISSCNIPTMPIGQAQKMFPPPRPPSPASRARLQKARLAANQELLMQKDPSVLMNMQRIAAGQRPIATPPSSPPHSLLRPTRSIHRKKIVSLHSPPDSATFKPTQQEQILLNWINSNLPRDCPRKAEDFSASIRSGLIVVRLVESLTGSRSGLVDEAFEVKRGDDMFNDVDIYFNVFDYLNQQRIPLEGYALNDMISADPMKNKEFLGRIYGHFNRSKNFVLAQI
ncbi:hypothetical protein CROQUDRAFT_40729 [Cronartium quercuum f. sp. fusiforme G11]|uniref:Polar growth protein n=1 Tax=Cronartium quercuum f. sp. fusiforme G11 TaxID=708437 RepID=A0A9P6NKQ1_9BASI|nr:hypothetical protein CROQUDRAFT_40729 [Cronartium quercuum f. sp. fusiforme G11]